ncbi:hypothetical protein K435DRAFT_925313, partial [Dendrothele bispora CBS 962.96]
MFPTCLTVSSVSTLRPVPSLCSLSPLQTTGTLPSSSAVEMIQITKHGETTPGPSSILGKNRILLLPSYHSRTGRRLPAHLHPRQLHARISYHGSIHHSSHRKNSSSSTEVRTVQPATPIKHS